MTQASDFSQDKENRNELRYKVAIRFVIDGDLRFISHHDAMRLFERALARAQLPVKFSQGHNPRPRLSLPLPRAVGVATTADLLVVELAGAYPLDQFLAELAEQMPPGIELIEAWWLTEKRAPQPIWADYRLPLAEDRVHAVSEAVDRLTQSETWTTERITAGRRAPKLVDLKAKLAWIRVDGTELCWRARIEQTGSVRPAEILEAVGLPVEGQLHRMQRIAVGWEHDASTQDRVPCPQKDV